MGATAHLGVKKERKIYGYRKGDISTAAPTSRSHPATLTSKLNNSCLRSQRVAARRHITSGVTKAFAHWPSMGKSLFYSVPSSKVLSRGKLSQAIGVKTIVSSLQLPPPPGRSSTHLPSPPPALGARATTSPSGTPPECHPMPVDCWCLLLLRDVSSLFVFLSLCALGLCL
jgi:hypothetical protein